DRPLYRVDGLLLAEGDTLLVAQKKAGKTTMLLNMAACLVSGEPFLGAYGVRPIQGNVAYLNYEMNDQLVARWVNDLGIPDRRLLLVNLRGGANPLAYPDDRRELARRLREAKIEILLVDPFGKAFTGTEENSNSEVNRWTAELDAFAR